MKSFKRILLGILAFLPLVVTAAAVLFYLPDQVILHFDFNGNVDRMGSKLEAFIFPCIVIVMYAVYLGVRASAKKSQDEQKMKNLDVIETVFTAIFAMFNALCAAILIASKDPESMSGGDSLLAVIMATAIGVMLIIIGNVMPKSRRNSMLGMRLSFAMDTDEHWYLANRNGGIALVVTGVVTIAAGLILRDVIGYTVAMLITLILTSAIAILRTYVKIKKEK